MEVTLGLTQDYALGSEVEMRQSDASDQELVRQLVLATMTERSRARSTLAAELCVYNPPRPRIWCSHPPSSHNSLAVEWDPHCVVEPLASSCSVSSLGSAHYRRWVEIAKVHSFH